MKKIIFLGISLLAGLVSCTKDYTDWASPQSNSASEAAEKMVMTVQPTVSSILLSEDHGESIQLFTTNLSEDQVYVYVLEVNGDADGAPAFYINADSKGYVKVEEIAEAVTTIYGKRPVERTLNITVSANVDVTTVDGVVNVQRYSDPFTLQVTPDAPFIDSAYYLTGDFAGWNKEGALPFTHLGGDDVYENPQFQIMFTVTAANQYWKIISGTNYNGDFWAEGKTGVVGIEVDGDTSFEGSLTTTSPKAGKIENPGMYVMTINMMDYTYSIKSVAPQFYMVGALPGWSAEGAQTALLYPKSGTVMSYTSKYTGAWDLKLWNKNDLGNWDNCYGCVVDGDNSPSGALINSGAQAISAPSADFYTFTIDLAAMTYTWTKLDNQAPTEYSAIGVIGDFNSWSADLELKQVTPHNWYAVGTVTAGGLKFRANHDWAVNWGADLSVSDSEFFGVGVGNGPNIYVPAGTYAFYMNDITGEFAIVQQ